MMKITFLRIQKHPPFFCWGICAIGLAFLFGNQNVAAESSPNIFLLMGDDHGWEETAYNGHPHVKTPVLDEMARTGFRTAVQCKASIAIIFLAGLSWTIWPAPCPGNARSSSSNGHFQRFTFEDRAHMCRAYQHTLAGNLEPLSNQLPSFIANRRMHTKRIADRQSE